eukprot:jgi/Tetstr1/455981/TSEL_042760.t1
MGRHNSKRRMPEGREGWTPATGTWEAAMKRVASWRWDNEDADPADRELLMKVIYTDGDEEELTKSEIQLLYLTLEQLSDFTRRLPQGAIDDPPAELRELQDADSDAEGIVAGLVDGNPSDDSHGDSDGEGDAAARMRARTAKEVGRRDHCRAVPGENVDEGSSPEPPAKKAKQPAKPAAGGLAQGLVVPGPGRAVGRSGRGPAAGPP